MEAYVNDVNTRKRRAALAEEAETTKRKRLAHAMEELNLGTPANIPPEWGAPFGTRTRLRTSPRRERVKKKKRDSFEFDGSFKRALGALGALDNDTDTDTMNQASPTKRRRDNNSRALVLYRGPSSPRDLIPNSHSDVSSPIKDIWTALPHSVPKVIIEQPPDGEDVTNSIDSGDMEVDEIIIAEDDRDDWNREKALIAVSSVVQQRRAAFERAAKQANLVHTQTAILMPWRDNRQQDGDVEME